jgi:DNA-binding XRE family transcriptional regulator
MDWQDILRIQCDLKGVLAVSRELGVARNTVYQTLKGQYAASNKKLKSLVEEYFSNSDVKPPEDNPHWKEELAWLCEKYSVRAVARELGVSYQPLYMILSNRYTENTKVKQLFLLRSDDFEERLNSRQRKKGGKTIRVGRYPRNINRTNELFLSIVDEIFCADVITEEFLCEKFPRYSLSRTLNYLVSNQFVDMVLLESQLHGKGRKPQKRAFKLSCGCAAPGLLEQCEDCPLGKEIVRIEGGFNQEFDQEEIQYAC